MSWPAIHWQVHNKTHGNQSVPHTGTSLYHTQEPVCPSSKISRPQTVQVWFIYIIMNGMWHIVKNKKWSETSRNTHTNIQTKQQPISTNYAGRMKQSFKMLWDQYSSVHYQAKNKYAIQPWWCYFLHPVRACRSSLLMNLCSCTLCSPEPGFLLWPQLTPWLLNQKAAHF